MAKKNPPTSGFVETDMIMNKTSNADSKAETIDDPFRFSVVTRYCTKHPNTPPIRAEHCGSYLKRSRLRLLSYQPGEGTHDPYLNQLSIDLHYPTFSSCLIFFSRNQEITASKVKCDAYIYISPLRNTENISRRLFVRVSIFPCLPPSRPN